MSIGGRVVNGVVIPDVSLPEGIGVRIEVAESSTAPQRSFIDRAKSLADRGSCDEALDILYAGVDDFLRVGQFTALNVLLRSVQVDDLSDDLILGILAATLPAKRRLPERTRIFEAFAAVLQSRGGNDLELLRGLEP